MDPNTKLTWNEVFDCKRNYGDIPSIAEVCYKAGYKYFIWNDRVYHLYVTLFHCDFPQCDHEHEELEWNCTDIKKEDVK